MISTAPSRLTRLAVHDKTLATDSVMETPRRLPVRGRYDVIICGGGPAGVGAAIAAGRSGARVLLIERWGFAGGMWTAGLVNPFFEWRDRGFVVQDLVARLRDAAAFQHWCGSYCFKPEAMKLILEQMLTEAGVELLYYTLGVDAIVLEERVAGVVIESKAGREAILGKVVVDATGDGDIAARAGCRFEFGRAVDAAVQPMTLMFEIRNIGGYRNRDSHALFDQLSAVLAESGDDFQLPFHRSRGMPYIITMPGDDCAAVQATHIYRLNPLDPRDLTLGSIAARRQVDKLMQLLAKLPGFQNVQLNATAPSLGLRESRRVLGRYWLDVNDLRTGSSFPDGICAATFPVDVHEPAPGSNLPSNNAIRMLPYEIPYRSLLPADVGGLLLAGRCISGDHLAHASYRVTGTMMAVGQAAGLAAAAAAQHNCDPAELDGRALKLDLASKGCKFVADGVSFTDGRASA